MKHICIHKAKKRFQILLEETAKYIKVGQVFHHLELDPQISDRVSDLQPYSTILEQSVKPAETPSGM